jgi:hypothetical protein
MLRFQQLTGLIRPDLAGGAGLTYLFYLGEAIDPARAVGVGVPPRPPAPRDMRGCASPIEPSLRRTTASRLSYCRRE